MEVVGLIKAGENFDACVKFRNNSIILDCQRSPFDKSSLGYNSGKENSVADTWKPSKYEANPSFSKSESNVAPHVAAHNKEDLKRSKRHQGDNPTPQCKFRRETTPIWNQAPMYEDGFNGYCYSCNNFGHKAMDCRFYERRSV